MITLTDTAAVKVKELLTAEGADDLALRVAVRPGDLVARLGGDEFAIVFSDAEPKEAAAISERLIERIRALGADYPGTSLGASAGISCSRQSPSGVEELVRRADDAMYRSKALGKGRVGEG